MLTPHSYLSALLLMLLSMLCWGSWANTQKIDKGWRFELFYLDYTVGLVIAATVMGMTLGNVHPGAADSFWVNLRGASGRSVAEAFAGGLIFSIGNLLLVAAISVAGMAVAFPVGAGLGLVIGAVLNYLVSPMGNAWLIFGGIGLVVVAIVLDALAYKAHLSQEAGAATASGSKGIVLSVLGGIGAGLFYPPVAKSLVGAGHLVPYTVDVVFALGALVSAVPMVWILMKRPVAGASLGWKDYGAGGFRVHAWGWLGGAVWGVGTLANFVASAVPMIGPATSFAMGEGNTMISAVWGVFVWKEFAGASGRVRWLLGLMFLCFLAGLTAIALAPVL